MKSAVTSGLRRHVLRRSVFFLIAALTIAAPRCDVPEAHHSQTQRRLMAPKAEYSDFFATSNLPRAEDLPSYYFIEDLNLPTESFSPQALLSTRRRLQQLFEHYIYGYAPELPRTALKLIEQRSGVDVGNGVKARVRLYDLTLLLNVEGRDNPNVHLTLFLPESAEADPVPVFLTLNKCGSHRVAPSGVVPIRREAFMHKDCLKEEFERTGTTAAWNVDLILSSGMALATFHESDLAADDEVRFRDGVFSYFPQARYRGPNGWRTIAIWSWGLRAVADSLAQVRELKKDGVMVIGHSRRGKASLWAAALAPEIAAVFAHQSGTWGLALARHHDLQSREHYTQIVHPTAAPVLGSKYEKILYNDFLFDHWFNEESESFKWDESRLPLDQHLLLALLAPRPVLSTEGWRDNWANYDSSWTTLQEGSRYYRYVQSGGLIPERPLNATEMQTQAKVGPLMQVRLDEEHLLTRAYWMEILEFARRIQKSN